MPLRVNRCGHEPRVTDADAEAERTHRARIGDVLAELLDHAPRPDVIGREDVGERRRRRSPCRGATALAQVEPVVNAVVGERREVLLVDRVPQPQLGGDASVEVAEDVEPVGALRRRRKPEQLTRVDVLEDPLVRRRSRVMELVDDDDVEVRRVERCRGRQR